MGRWSQRRHCGGGPQLPPLTPITITDVAAPTALELDVTFSSDVNSADFVNGDWLTVPGSKVPIAMTQIDTNQIELTFPTTIAAQTSLTYSGTAPGVISPQTIEID